MRQRSVFNYFFSEAIRYAWTSSAPIGYYKYNIANNSIIGPTSPPLQVETFLFALK